MVDLNNPPDYIVFEHDTDAITKMDFMPARKNMDFSKALYILKQGHKVTRKSWNNVNMYVYLKQVGKDDIVLWRTDTVRDKIVERWWYIGNTDLLAEDWMIVT